MPTPLPQPFEVSPGPVLQAMRMGQADRLAEEQRGALKSAGALAAQGNLAGARNSLYSQGMMDEGARVDQMLRQADADTLAKTQRSHTVLGNLALAADTPEKWAMAVDAAEKNGIDASKFRDFGSRDMLLAQSGMVGQKIDMEMKRRALEVKETPAPYVFSPQGVGNKYTGEFKALPGGVGADAGKLSNDYRWRTANGQPILDASGRPIAEPIPGGKGEAVTPEVSARLGMADKFAKDLPNIEAEIKQGTLNGMDFQLGRGKAGEIYRRIEDGSEALIRNLTGAGMNETEARSYAERFLPGRLDMPSTKLEKVRNLARNLEAVRNRVLIGRGIASVDDLEREVTAKPGGQDRLPREGTGPESRARTAEDPLGILSN